MKTLLIPGMSCDKRLWQLISPELSSLDLVYCDITHQDTMADYFATIDEFPGAINIIAFSLGAIIATEYMVSRPGKVFKAALMSFSHLGLNQQRRDNLIKLNNILALKSELKWTPRLANELLAESSLNSRAEEITESMTLDLGPQTVVRQRSATINRLNLANQLHQLHQTKFKLMIGDSDKRVPLEHMKQFSSEIGEELNIIADCGHMLPLEKPKAAAKIILPFLSTNYV